MKKLSYFIVAATLVGGGLMACQKTEPVVDYPIQGVFTLQGTYKTYSHGLQGWTKEDEIGVYVTSEGVAQTNLKYVPSSLVESTTFKAIGDEAGFKQGVHNIYAYVPYSEGNQDYTAVKLPDLDSQEYKEMVFVVEPQYCFAYASIKGVKEYSAEVMDFGAFKTPFTQVTIPSPEFPESIVGGEKITKVVLSSTIDLSCKDATINLETGEIKGTMSKSIEVKLPEGGVEITKSYFGAEAPIFFLEIASDYATAKEVDYTLTMTINGKEYSATGKPGGIALDGNVNLAGAFKFE
ncbi:MAG: fimbrillin family protein [Candidatus Cryptobacteroides sp.]|nr:fimbrillin family protein [Candidatus Cryptobacteroides sp.]